MTLHLIDATTGVGPAAYDARVMAATPSVAATFRPTMSAVDSTWSALDAAVAVEGSVRSEASRRSVAPTGKPNASD